MERGASEAGNSLPITRWSLIARAGQSAESAQRVALTELLTRYLPAMRAHLSARGRFRADEVDDLLQGFVANKVLEQNLVAAADRNRGRFRTFLLTSLDNYVANVVRERGAAKRSPPGGRPPESLDERGDVAAPPPGPDPFDVVWAQQVFREAMARMRFECEVAGRSDLWSLFDARVAAPLLHGHDVVPYDQLVARLGFASPSQATNALATAKRTFQRMLRSVVGEYADGEADIDRELADLRRVLERSV